MKSGLRFLIVCSDKRAGTLAAVLSSAGRVYRRGNVQTGWNWMVWQDGKWKRPEEDVPKSFDALFFHTGSGDPLGIPADATFAREIAFSGGGVGADVHIVRPKAVGIQRPFTSSDNPIEARHLEELAAFIANPDALAPSFCALPRVAPGLASLAIVCQLYAVAGVAAGAIDLEGAFAARVGLDRIGPVRLARIRESFAGQWPLVQTRDYWRQSLGLTADGQGSSDERLRSFLKRLLEDIGADSGGETDALIARIASGPAAGAADLLTRDPVELTLVEAAYDQISALLSRQ